VSFQGFGNPKPTLIDAVDVLQKFNGLTITIDSGAFKRDTGVKDILGQPLGRLPIPPMRDVPLCDVLRAMLARVSPGTTFLCDGQGIEITTRRQALVVGQYAIRSRFIAYQSRVKTAGLLPIFWGDLYGIEPAQLLGEICYWNHVMSTNAKVHVAEAMATPRRADAGKTNRLRPIDESRGGLNPVDMPLFKLPPETNLENHQPIAAGILKATKVFLYEGLPHQQFERRVLEQERKSKKTLELHCFSFYQELLPLKEDDAQKLLELVCTSGSFQRWDWLKLCGQFHPDYCLEWQQGKDSYRVLVLKQAKIPRAAGFRSPVVDSVSSPFCSMRSSRIVPISTLASPTLFSANLLLTP